MSLNLKSSSETAAYQSDSMAIAQGITFHLPSRRRFIPYSWLLYAELNEAEAANEAAGTSVVAGCATARFA